MPDGACLFERDCVTLVMMVMMVVVVLPPVVFPFFSFSCSSLADPLSLFSLRFFPFSFFLAVLK